MGMAYSSHPPICDYWGCITQNYPIPVPGLEDLKNNLHPQYDILRVYTIIPQKHQHEFMREY